MIYGNIIPTTQVFKQPCKKDDSDALLTNTVDKSCRVCVRAASYNVQAVPFFKLYSHVIKSYLIGICWPR